MTTEPMSSAIRPTVAAMLSTFVPRKLSRVATTSVPSARSTMPELSSVAPTTDAMKGAAP